MIGAAYLAKGRRKRTSRRQNGDDLSRQARHGHELCNHQLDCDVIGLIGLQHYLILAAILFVCGLLTILLKRNAIGILMGVELILNAANINLVAFNRFAHGGCAARSRWMARFSRFS